MKARWISVEKKVTEFNTEVGPEMAKNYFRKLVAKGVPRDKAKERTKDTYLRLLTTTRKISDKMRAIMELDNLLLED
ncbi:hypothetical protein TWF694_010144 [Orbilia ellipsospora]|uniref:Uncharacterized protein n=1 Tax=Orbilia ellipsospora TaxID=2528407 RepID=A0AAV9X916_9PEZI